MESRSSCESKKHQAKHFIECYQRECFPRLSDDNTVNMTISRPLHICTIISDNIVDFLAHMSYKYKLHNFV